MNALISSSNSVGGGDLKVLGSYNVSADDLKRPFVKPPLQRQVSYEKGKLFCSYVVMVMMQDGDDVVMMMTMMIM